MVLTNYKNESIQLIYNKNNVHIVNSYKIPKCDISNWICRIRDKIKEESKIVYSRSNESWYNEWCAHNLLYEFNIQKNRTKSVDLNENESLYRLILYKILSLLY